MEELELVIKKRPVFECVLPSKASEKIQSHVDSEFIPFVIDEDISVTRVALTHGLASSRKTLNESITNPSRLSFVATKFSEVNRVYSELNFNNKEVYTISFNIIQELAKNKNFDVKISKSSENEILFYSESDGRFKNLLIDNDGDIQYIFVGKKIGEEKSQLFSADELKDYSVIASLV
jgi:hypothetical protein